MEYSVAWVGLSVDSIALKTGTKTAARTRGQRRVSCEKATRTMLQARSTAIKTLSKTHLVSVQTDLFLILDLHVLPFLRCQMAMSKGAAIAPLTLIEGVI